MEIKEKMLEHRFGIEIEMTGITREKAATIVAEHVNGRKVRAGGYYDKWEIFCPEFCHMILEIEPHADGGCPEQVDGFRAHIIGNEFTQFVQAFNVSFQAFFIEIRIAQFGVLPDGDQAAVSAG